MGRISLEPHHRMRYAFKIEIASSITRPAVEWWLPPVLWFSSQWVVGYGYWLCALLLGMARASAG